MKGTKHSEKIAQRDVSDDVVPGTGAGPEVSPGKVSAQNSQQVTQELG